MMFLYRLYCIVCQIDLDFLIFRNQSFFFKVQNVRVVVKK